MALRLLERLVPLLGSHTPAGKDVLDTVQKLSKHVPPGANNPAAEQQQIQKLMLQRAQMSGMRPPGAGGPPGAPPGAGGPPPGAGMPPPGAGGPPGMGAPPPGASPGA